MHSIRRDPSRPILAEQLGRRSPPGLIVEIDIGKRLSAAVAHDKAGGFVAFAKSAIAEAKVVASEIAAMPAGGHPILQQAQQAVERRAQRLLLQLQELDNERTVKAIDEAAGQEKGSGSWR
jgi:hypothetical protein